MKQNAMTVHPQLNIQHFFEPDSHTFTYVVWDSETRTSAIIDPVLDYNHQNVTSHTKHADEIIAYLKQHHLRNAWILETHLHADHITASDYLKKQVGGKKAIGKKVQDVQRYLKKVFDLNEHFKTDGSQFDVLFSGGDTFTIGSIPAIVIHAPGHTPADLVYDIGGALFVGDTIFAPDIGTARCDFPGGSAETLYDSIRALLDRYPDETSLYLCHDYPEGRDRAPIHHSTIGRQRRENIHVRDGVTKSEFVKMRTTRDASLDLPRYIFPSVQINGNGGTLTPGEFIKLTYNKRVL